MAEGVDYQSRPGGAALKAAGKSFAIRYLYYPGATKPTLTAAEKTDLLNHGISIGLVMEVYGDDCYRGYGWGQQLGIWAKSAANALGLGTLPVYFAVDRDVNVGQRTWDANRSAAVRDFLNGAASVVGHARMGVYGGFYVVEWALSNGLATYAWQTYAWSAGKVSSRAHVLQYDNIGNTINGVSVDLDRSLKADFGQYPRPSSIPDTSTPPPKENGLPMRIQIPSKPRYVEIRKGVALRLSPHLSGDKIRNTTERERHVLTGHVQGDSYKDAEGTTHNQWCVIWLPAWWSKNDPWDGRWAYFKRTGGHEIDCAPIK